MKVKLLKNCVIGRGKTGEKGKTVDVSQDNAKALLSTGSAKKIDGKDKADK